MEAYTSYRKYLNYKIAREIEKILDIEEGVVERALLDEVRYIANSRNRDNVSRKSELAKHLVYLACTRFR